MFKGDESRPDAANDGGYFAGLGANGLEGGIISPPHFFVSSPSTEGPPELPDSRLRLPD